MHQPPAAHRPQAFAGQLPPQPVQGGLVVLPDERHGGQPLQGQAGQGFLQADQLPDRLEVQFLEQGKAQAAASAQVVEQGA